MNNTVKLIVSILLGVGAAVTNFYWLQDIKKPPTYVGISKNVKAGETLSSKSLIAVPVPGDREIIGKSLIPFENRAVVYGMATRDYRANDVVFYRDIEPEKRKKKSKLKLLGPFRIEDARGDTVTLAVSDRFSEKYETLISMLGSSKSRIRAIQVIPKQEAELTRKALQESKEDHYVHQTISLRGIEGVPPRLAKGEIIRFVITARR